MSLRPARRRVISRVKRDLQRSEQRKAIADRYKEKQSGAIGKIAKVASESDSNRSSAGEKRRRKKSDAPPHTRGMTAEFCRESVDVDCDSDDKKLFDQGYTERVRRLESGLQSAMADTANDRSVYAYNYVPESKKSPSIDWRREDIDVTDDWFVPRSLDQVVDNGRSIDALDRWLALWTAKPCVLPRRCAAFVRGPPGVGKTTTVRLALQKHGFKRVIEINGSDQRSKAMVARLYSLVMQSSVDSPFGRTAIVIEEADGMQVGSGGGSRARTARGSSESTSAVASAGGGAESVAGDVAAPHEEADDAANELTVASAHTSGVIGASGGGGSSGSDALIKFLKSNGICPKRCDRRGLQADTASAVGDETWVPFRSTVPIIFLANESSAAFMKKLSELTLLLRFWPVGERQVRYRIVNQLSVALNVKWSRPKSEGAYQDLPLYDVLVAHSAGDLRKATSLMACVVRAAYSRRLTLPADHRERQEPFLLVRRTDCVAFFGESKEDVMDSVPTLFGAARFLLCQMRCRCQPEHQCSCTKRRSLSSERSETAVERAGSVPGEEKAMRYLTPRRATVFQQAQRMATHDIRVLPHMLFENAHRCAAEPKRCHEVESRLAASRVRCALTDWFAAADALRADTQFLRDRRLQEFYMQFGMVAPSLIVRYPERYVPIAPNSVERPVAIERAHGGARINLQKSSLDGENGNGAHTLSLAKDERNAYVRHFNLPYQVDLSRWFDSNNYVSKLDETRAQKRMLCQDKRKESKRKARDDDLVVQKSKMTKSEVARLREEMRNEQRNAKQSVVAPIKKSSATSAPSVPLLLSSRNAAHAKTKKQVSVQSEAAKCETNGGNEPPAGNNNATANSATNDKTTALSRRRIKTKL